MRRPARDTRGREERGEELLRHARAGEHHRGPEIDVRRVRPFGMRLVEDLERELLGPGCGLVELWRCGLRHLPEDLRSRVVRAVHAVPEAREALMPVVGLGEPLLRVPGRANLV